MMYIAIMVLTMSLLLPLCFQFLLILCYLIYLSFADIDECVLSNTNKCSVYANCTDTIGSYECTCSEGFAGDGITCHGRCRNILHDCICLNIIILTQMLMSAPISIVSHVILRPFATILLVALHAPVWLGTLEMEWHAMASQSIKCIDLYTLWKYLLDINECELDTDICDNNAECKNTIGSYNCSCEIGYSGNGFNCTGTVCLASR